MPERTANVEVGLKAAHRLVWIAIMAALIAVGGVMAIPVNPLSPVPVTAQTLFVLLAGLILGPRDAVKAVELYFLAGVAGLPVFAGGKAGLAVLIGPTGGFLLGFLPAVAVCGLAKRRPSAGLPVLMAYCLLATIITLGAGALQLSLVLDVSPGRALAVGALPFVPGALLKIVAAASIYRLMAARRLLPG